MCKFKSGIVVRDEREKGGFKLYMSPWTESHGEIETLFNLRDKGDNLAKVEFSPSDMAEAYLPDKYKFSIDQKRTPDWFDVEMQKSVAEQMKDYIKTTIVSGDIALLMGGQFIIAPGAKVSFAHTMMINAICGGTVSEIWEHFNGTIGKISKAAKIISDNRKP
jgi:hypothetical protein